MECSEPGAIRDEELVAYLEGEWVRPAIGAHLALCPACSSKLAAFRRLNLQLMAKLYRWDCPPSQVLGEHQLHMLDNEMSFAVATHLRTCVLCAAEVITLTDFLVGDPLLERVSFSSSPASLSPPPFLYEYPPAQHEWRAASYVREHMMMNVQRVVASLLPSYSGVALQRTPLPQLVSWPRQYSAADITIALQLEEDTQQRGTLQLIGLVNSQGLAIDAFLDSSVQLFSLDASVALQQVDDLGNFIFTGLPPATYNLELHLPDKTIVVEQLVVQINA